VTPVDKAIWYIESHYREDVSLETLAAVVGVSRYHLCRAFAFATGQPVGRYLRHRRLSLAALALAEGRGDILDLALSLGYGSHEAFTRAFRAHFGLTPEALRKRGNTRNLKLVEAITMNQTRRTELPQPEFLDGPLLLIAGLVRSYGFDQRGEIPGQWQDFGPMIGHLPGQQNGVAYGVIYNGDDERFDYLTGVAVEDFSSLRADTARLRIPQQHYAVFRSAGHVTQLQGVCNAVWADWLPASGYEVVDAPWFERYPESFDPATGGGGFEIWLPLERAPEVL
jgi:AraC family transcriptional regulator